MTEFVGVAEVAALLGVRAETVRSYASRGQMPAPIECRCCGRTPVWRRDWIEQWARNRTAG